LKDGFLEFLLDDGNEIHGFDVVNVEITFKPVEGFMDWRELIQLY